MACAKACLRKYYLRYEVGIERNRVAEPLRIGTAFHIGLEERANGKSLDDFVAIATAGYAEVPRWAQDDDEALDDWLTERETVAAMLAGYHWRWQDERITVVKNEMSFSLPVLNPATGAASTFWTRRGKIDKIVVDEDGATVLMEHKTCSEDLSVDSDYWMKLRIDHQISGYVDAGIALGNDIRDVLYDCARKPEISPMKIPELDADGVKIVLDRSGERVRTKDGKKWRESGDAKEGYFLQTRRESPQEFGARLLADMGERPEFYFARRRIPRLDTDLEDYRQELWDQAADLRERRRNGRWYRNTNACAMMGKCTYFDLCTNNVKVDENNVPDGFRLLADVHPELGGTKP